MPVRAAVLIIPLPMVNGVPAESMPMKAWHHAHQMLARKKGKHFHSQPKFPKCIIYLTVIIWGPTELFFLYRQGPIHWKNHRDLSEVRGLLTASRNFLWLWHSPKTRRIFVYHLDWIQAT